MFDPDLERLRSQDFANDSTQVGSAVSLAGSRFRELDLRDRIASRAPWNHAELLELICNDQVRQWRAGLRIPAEAYLALHESLGQDDAGFEVVYGEFMVRESLGEPLIIEELCWRFPRFADRLQRQLELHRAFDSSGGTLKSTQAVEPTLAGLASIEDEGLTDGPFLPGYRILSELGRGGMGVVYKARQLSLQRLVALKLIHPGVYTAAESAARFRAEAETVARFQHPNVVQVHEIGEHEGVSYLCLEYAEGGSLQQKVAGTPQDPRAAALLVEELARAIHYAHLRGIVHRDLKPANVVLTDQGIPKVTDFGLAKLLEDPHTLTHSGAVLGTPSYMAPEQTRGGRAITPAVDIYALGAILYELLTGRPPFKGATPLSTLELVTTQDPLPPSKFHRQTPFDLETICLKCLEKEPQRRYATALDLAEDLRRFLDGRPIQARPASLGEQLWKWAKRRKSLAAALGALILASVLLFAGSIYYNARLSSAVRSAQTAERSADQSARAAQEQRNLSLKLLDRIIFEVQDKLGETPATRQLRRSLLSSAITELDQIARKAEATAPDLSRAVAHERLGEIYLRIGRSTEAFRQLDQARELGEALAAASPGDVAVAESLCRACLALGELELGAGQPVKAKSLFRRAVELAEQVAGDDLHRDGARRALLETYYELGRAYSFAGNLDGAAALFQKTHDLALRWLAEAPDERQALSILAATYRKLGDVKKLTRNYRSAQRDYREAITIGRRLVAAEPDHREFKLNLARALDDLGSVLHTAGDLPQAATLFEQVEQLCTALLAADPEELDARLLLVNSLERWAGQEKEQRHFDRASELFQEALDHLERMEREHQLEGRPALRNERIPSLRQQLAECSVEPH